MKLFVATFPNTECDKFTKDICKTMSLAWNCEMKSMPEERDANYYMIDFGEYPGAAEKIEREIKAGPNGMMRLFGISDITRSVYGLYRTEILLEDISLNDWINR